MTAPNKNYDIGGFVDDLNGAIRKNPVAAGLVGTGILWMFFGGFKLSAFGQVLPAVSTPIKGAVSAVAQSSGSAVGVLSGTVARVSTAALQVGDAVAEGAANTATRLQDAATAGFQALSPDAGGAPSTVSADRANDVTSAGVGQRFGNSLQHNSTETLDRQPLLLGVIGLAIGAGLASAVPSTEIEQDMMGEAGAKLKDRLQQATEFTMERAQNVLDDVNKEAAAQGLTPVAAKDALKGLAEKAKSVGTASGDAIKKRFS